MHKHQDLNENEGIGVDLQKADKLLTLQENFPQSIAVGNGVKLCWLLSSNCVKEKNAVFFSLHVML